MFFCYCQASSFRYLIDHSEIPSNLRKEADKDTRWASWDPPPDHMDAGPFRDIRRKFPNLHILIEDLNLCSTFSTYNQSDPPLQLHSCKTVAWCTKKYAKNKALFLQAPNLKTLHLINKNLPSTRISNSNINKKDRLPPLEELKLVNYDWSHSPRKAVSFWNWSQLVRLQLFKVHIVLFLQTVPPQHLKLQEFTTDDWRCTHAEGKEATRLICGLLTNIVALQRIDLICDVAEQAWVDAVCKHGPTLRTLQLLNYPIARGRRLLAGPRRVWADDEASERLLGVHQLASIQIACPHLTTLTIRYHPRNNEVCKYSAIIDLEGTSPNK